MSQPIIPIPTSSSAVISHTPTDSASAILNKSTPTRRRSMDDCIESEAKKQKRSNMKELYNVRRQLLEVEQERVAAIDRLTAEMAEHNRIQRERNELIKKIYKID